MVVSAMINKHCQCDCWNRNHTQRHAHFQQHTNVDMSTAGWWRTIRGSGGLVRQLSSIRYNSLRIINSVEDTRLIDASTCGPEFHMYMYMSWVVVVRDVVYTCCAVKCTLDMMEKCQIWSHQHTTSNQMLNMYHLTTQVPAAILKMQHVPTTSKGCFPYQRLNLPTSKATSDNITREQCQGSCKHWESSLKHEQRPSWTAMIRMQQERPRNRPNMEIQAIGQQDSNIHDPCTKTQTWWWWLVPNGFLL